MLERCTCQGLMLEGCVVDVSPLDEGATVCGSAARLRGEPGEQGG